MGVRHDEGAHLDQSLSCFLKDRNVDGDVEESMSAVETLVVKTNG